MDSDTIVFLGPTLEIKTAKKYFQEALYLPPIQTGDIIRALSFKPKVIAIIDGYFEHTPSVWHKEILYALEKDICVYGASSMGAIRAAELADFGMIGVGKIYNKYITNELVDDDEVAIAHGSEDYKFKPLSEAMVNIRATVENAEQNQMIDASLAVCLINIAKSVFYPKRTIELIINNAIQLMPEKKFILLDFFAWCKRGHYVDQKKLDAIELITLLSKKSSKRCVFKDVNLSMSYYFRTLEKKISCSDGGFICKNPTGLERAANSIKTMLANNFYSLARLAHCYSMASCLFPNNQDGPNYHSLESDIEKSLTQKDQLNKLLLVFIKESGEYAFYKKSVQNNNPAKLLELYKSDKRERYAIAKLTAAIVKIL